MFINEVTGSREDYWPLLLLADPSREMVRRYFNDGFMLKATEGDKITGIIITVPIDQLSWEIKNLAVEEACQGRGIGRALISAVANRLQKGTALLVGTSDLGAEFYRKCGFSYYRTEREFFTKHYPEPIFENGVQCVNMIYLKQLL